MVHDSVIDVVAGIYYKFIDIKDEICKNEKLEIMRQTTWLTQ